MLSGPKNEKNHALFKLHEMTSLKQKKYKKKAHRDFRSARVALIKAAFICKNLILHTLKRKKPG